MSRALLFVLLLDTIGSHDASSAPNYLVLRRQFSSGVHDASSGAEEASTTPLVYKNEATGLGGPINPPIIASGGSLGSRRVAISLIGRA